MTTLLVLYHSRTGSVAAMANEIAEAAMCVGIDVKIRTFEQVEAHDIVVSHDDLITCDGIAFGAPTRFGMMPAVAKAFWDTTSELWLKGQLIDKPAAVFTSSSSMHGGNEATLLGMSMPLLHHGMMLLGVPYDEPALNRTDSGGTPYGASHVSGHRNNPQLSTDEIAICHSVGTRIANLIKKLT